MKIVLSPHADDACLFASFTILRERAYVVTVFASEIQGNTEQRRSEDRAAMAILGTNVQHLGADDVRPNPEWIEQEFRKFGQPEMVYAPAFEEGGHVHHNLVAKVAERVFNNVTYYMTYTRNGKSIGPVQVPVLMPLLKLKALACYESQIVRKDNYEHFLRPQFEYYQ